METKKIAQQLAQLKYATLKGALVDERKYKENMDYLVDKKLAVKNNDGYTITPKGEEYLRKCEFWSNDVFYTYLSSIQDKPNTFDYDNFTPSLESKLIKYNLVEKKNNKLVITEEGKKFIKKHNELKN